MGQITWVVILLVRTQPNPKPTPPPTKKKKKTHKTWSIGLGRVVKLVCWMCTVTTEAQEGSFENITKKKREGKTCKAFGGSVCFCNVIYNNFVGTYNISSHPHFIFKLMKKMLKITGKLVPTEGALEKQLFINGVQNLSCKLYSSLWTAYQLLALLIFVLWQSTYVFLLYVSVSMKWKKIR